MRNLRKTLCLVLVLVFVLGLCTVGAAGTAYGDEDDIQYDTAVKAMSGLGILQGDDNDGDGVNEFRPKDPFTRAQAAKVIAYMKLGRESAELWPAASTFTDVGADHWAARYISYCKHEGIIDGMGDGTFQPNGALTQAAFSKMVLAAAGYGAKGEFTGPNWDQNVAGLAMQTKILKGLGRDAWNEPATREETALIAYNGMMNMVQVVLSSDTASYVPKTINGSTNVTLAQSTWELVTEEGVIIANKTNSSAAKGTIIAGGKQAYYVTELDMDNTVLGHKVQITYRIETEGTNSTAVAYFVDDECTEVNGVEAAKHDDAPITYAFTSGELKGTVPAKSARSTDTGIFVLDGDGRVVAYKTDGFFIATLAVNGVTGAASVTEPYGGTAVTVLAPEGAKSGDIVTVFHNGDVYLAKAAVKKTGVAITQSALDKTSGFYTYNDGAVCFTKADKFGATVLSGLTKMDGSAQLEVGYSYTLFFDSEGGCIGFADKVSSGVTVSSDCVFLVTTYTGKDAYGSDTYKVQVIRMNGAVEDLTISKADYDAGLVPGVYKLGTSGSFAALTPAGTSEFAYATYSTGDPRVDYTGATYVWYNGSLGSLQVKTDLKPQKDSYVYYTFKTEKVGTVDVRRVGTVWFTVPSTSVVTVSNSYIYVAGTAVESTKLVNGVVQNFYPGYLNGEKMNDLALAAAPAKTGFATYSKSADGIYTLTYVADGNGTATGVRTGLMTDNPTDFYFVNGKLYVKDVGGNLQSMDVTGLKIVKVGAAESSTLVLNSVDAVNNALVNGAKLTVTFLERVDSDGTHTIGGLTLYITNIA